MHFVLTPMPMPPGLSYADFALGSLTVVGRDGKSIHEDDTITLAIPLSNHCTRTNCGGSTVVQLYFEQQVAPVIRYYTQLVRFKRVYVPAGGSISVQFQLRIRDMAFWNNQEDGHLTGARGWSLGSAPGNFTLTAGLQAPALPNSAGGGQSTTIAVVAAEEK